MAAARQRKEPDLSTYSGRLAHRIRHLREQAGLSIEDAVESINAHGYQIEKPTYYAWENGGRAPALDAVPALTAAFKLQSIRTLFPLV